jgi:MYXO-CTERM domain-containing protein
MGFRGVVLSVVCALGARADVEARADRVVLTTGVRDAGPPVVDAGDGPYWAGLPGGGTWQPAELTWDGGELLVDFSASQAVAAGCVQPGVVDLLQVVPNAPFWLSFPADQAGNAPGAAWLTSTMTPVGQPGSLDCAVDVGFVAELPLELPQAGRWALTASYLVDNLLAGLTVDEGGPWVTSPPECASLDPFKQPCNLDAGEWVLDGGQHRLRFALINLPNSGADNPAAFAGRFTFEALELFDAGASLQSDDGGSDAGAAEVGGSDAGSDQPRRYAVGCTCASRGAGAESMTAFSLLVTLVAAAGHRRRRRAR